jgi:hypothetical protein
MEIGGVGASISQTRPRPERQSRPAEGDREDPAAPRGSDGRPLSREEQRVVRELQARDREVRAHETAHQAAGAGLASGASYTYQTGPDGRQYAVGGEVQIDTGAERDPRATIAKMLRVIAAALAPAEPSPQDRAVAAAARATMAEAQRQLQEQERAEREAASAGTESVAEPAPAASAPVSRLGPDLGGYRGGRDAGVGGLISLIA